MGSPRQFGLAVFADSRDGLLRFRVEDAGRTFAERVRDGAEPDRVAGEQWVAEAGLGEPQDLGQVLLRDADLASAVGVDRRVIDTDAVEAFVGAAFGEQRIRIDR